MALIIHVIDRTALKDDLQDGLSGLQFLQLKTLAATCKLDKHNKYAPATQWRVPSRWITMWFNADRVSVPVCGISSDSQQTATCTAGQSIVVGWVPWFRETFTPPLTANSNTAFDGGCSSQSALGTIFGKKPSPDALGPAVHDQVVNWLKCNSQGADPEDLKGILEKYVVPDNISMGVPHINTPIWDTLGKPIEFAAGCCKRVTTQR